MIDILIPQIFLGLSVGFILALVSFGLSITFGLMKVLNYAHGIFYALGAYLAYTSVVMLGNFFYAPLIFVPVVATIAVAMEKGFLRFLYKEHGAVGLIATAGATYIGIDLIKYIWGLYPRPVSDPIGVFIPVFIINIPAYRILVIVAAAIIFVVISYVFNKAWLGKIVKAALEDEEGVMNLGINIKRIYTIVYVIGALIAAIGGWLHAPLTSVYHQMPFDIITYAFAVVVFGGLGSLWGTLVSGIVMGLGIALVGVVYAPIAGIVPYIIMFVFLIFKPEGLFGSKT